MMDRLEKSPSDRLKKIQLQLLADMTAEAFGCPKVRLSRLSAEDALNEYAMFTLSCMSMPDPDPEKVFAAAYSLGEKVRRISGLSAREDLGRLVFLLYRNIDIEMEGSLPGGVTVRSCYFSRLYSPGQCALMSVCDSGIVSGIFGGGSLRFTGRITEGCDACTACFSGRKDNDE